MIKIGIVEDVNEEALDLTSKLERYFKYQNFNDEYKIKHYVDGISFLEKYKGGYSIIFLDIDMPKINGLEVAHKIRAIDEYVLIVFITHMSQFAIKAYEVEAFDYIVKPLTYEIFEVKMNRIIKTLNKRKKADKTVTIMVKRGVNKIFSVKDIYYVEVRGHTLIWHTIEGEFEFTATLSKTEQELSDFGFYRCNNYAIVNLRYVSDVSQTSLVCRNDLINISRQRKKGFLKALAEWLEVWGS